MYNMEVQWVKVKQLQNYIVYVFISFGSFQICRFSLIFSVMLFVLLNTYVERHKNHNRKHQNNTEISTMQNLSINWSLIGFQ